MVHVEGVHFIRVKFSVSNLVLIDMQNILAKVVSRQDHLILNVSQLLGSQVFFVYWLGD